MTNLLMLTALSIYLATQKEQTMDMLFLAVLLLCFALCAGLVQLCGKV